MNLLKAAFLLVSTVVAMATPGVLRAQGVNQQMLLHPPADSWPGYHGDYSGRRHSALNQLTPQNVKNLTLAWAFQTQQAMQIKSSPLLVDGILYFTVPDNIWAVDARSGHQIWHYPRPTNKGDHIGQRGVAMYQRYLFFLSPDAHLISLNSKAATVRWDKTVADVSKGCSTRPGDNLYTCSIVALNPDTGKLVWAFQVSPHDTHDWDAVEIPVLVDADFHGEPKKMLMQSSRNGYFFVLDRTNGKSLLTVPFGPVNWSLGVDQQGRPIPNPAKEPAPDGRLIAPDEGGMTNYRSPSFDTRTGLFIVDAHPSYSIYFAKPADGVYGWAGADYDLWGKGVIEAIDYQTGNIRWSHELGPEGSGAGVLTTDSGLTFTGDAWGNFLALDSSDGKTLWHAGSGAHSQSSPITYELDGRQYLLTSSGGVLFAWTLPES